MKRTLKILGFILLWAALAVAQENVPASSEKTILFYGSVADTSFAPGEKLNVEILETGEAIQTTVGENFSATLPADTLWNVCVTNSDTSGAEKEKCFELVYRGQDSVFSMTLGCNAETVNQYADGSTDSVMLEIPGRVRNDVDGTRNDTAQVAVADSAKLDDVNVDELLAASNTRTTEMKKVVVQLRRRPKRKAGESVVTAKSIKRMPGLAEADVIRSIQQLPGVVASSDFSTKIYVRGGAADQNLFLYDNAVVYSPTHFFGLFSTFLVETIDDVQFYKSGFPAQYGNRLSSVLKMEGRDGGKDTADEWFSRSSIKISTFAAQLHTEGLVGNSRWVVAARKTYIGPVLDLCNWLGVLDFTIDYGFADLQGTYKYQFSDDTDLKFSFYYGYDKLVFDPLYLDWGNTAIPINFRHRFGNFEYNATYAFSRFYQNMKISDLLSIGMDLYTWTTKQWINYRGIQNHTLTLGYELEYDCEKFFEEISETEYYDRQYPFHHVAYVQDAWQLAPNWTLAYGLRFNYQTLAEHFGVEPRSSLTWNIDETKTLEFYAGHYLQYMNSIMFTDQESLNEFYYPAVTTSKGKHLKPASSNLFAIEYSQRNIFDDYTATVGAYYKTQNNLNTFKMVNGASSDDAQSDDFLLADYFGRAEGYSMGYELSLRKDAGAVFGGVSWSQSLSVLKTDDGTKPYFPNWHQPYALKLDAGINWRGEDGIWQYKKGAPKGKFFRTSAVLKYSAGMPITEKIGYFYAHEMQDQQYSDNIVVVSDSRNAARQTNYFRLDIKVIDIGVEDKWNFSWTVINVTDHDNMFYSFYDTSENPPKYTTVSQFPYLPIMLNFEYYF